MTFLAFLALLAAPLQAQTPEAALRAAQAQRRRALEVDNDGRWRRLRESVDNEEALFLKRQRDEKAQFELGLKEELRAFDLQLRGDHLDDRKRRRRELAEVQKARRGQLQADQRQRRKRFYDEQRSRLREEREFQRRRRLQLEAEERAQLETLRRQAGR